MPLPFQRLHPVFPRHRPGRRRFPHLPVQATPHRELTDVGLVAALGQVVKQAEVLRLGDGPLGVRFDAGLRGGEGGVG